MRPAGLFPDVSLALADILIAAAELKAELRGADTDAYREAATIVDDVVERVEHLLETLAA